MEAIRHTRAMGWTYRSQSFELYVSMNGSSRKAKDLSSLSDVDKNCLILCNHLHKENPPVKWGIILQLLTVNISVGPPGFEPGTYAL